MLAMTMPYSGQGHC